jgi:putative ABC transport system permease protein
MFINYLKVAFRNLRRNKTNSIINVLGLAVGIACCVVISLYVQHELSYDRFYKNADSIYRVYIKSFINGQRISNCKTAAPLGNTLASDYPEVLTYSRIGFFGNHVLQYEDKVNRESHLYVADSNFFNVFSLPLVTGNPKTVLSQPNSIVMTKSTAHKYFGNENPVGKTLKANYQSPFTVTGVMEDFPNNSSFRCDILLSMSTYPTTQNNNWLDMSYTTYVVLNNGTDPVIFEKKLQKIAYDYVGPQVESVLGIPFREFLNKGNAWDFYLQPLTSIYLHSKSYYEIDSNTEWLDQSTSDIEYVYLFSAVAVFILLLAIINFVNLTTAISETRSKEVGIKKTLGSNRIELIKQFLVESIVVALLSILIAIGVAKITLPFFNQLAGKNLNLDLFGSLSTILGLLIFALVVGIISGSYPAFYLSSLRPVHLFRSGLEKINRKSTLRSGLVTVQFAVSIGLLIGTVIIRDQINFMHNRDLGFNKENLYAIKNFGVPEDRLHVFENELSKNPDIVSVTNSSVMFLPGIPGDGYFYDNGQIVNTISSQYMDVDYNFLKTFKVPLLRGRFFSEEFPSDTTSVVINEAMSKACGTEYPIGKDIIQRKTQTKAYKIIGVIKNFNYQSLHEHVRPLVLFLNSVRQPASLVTVRISSANIKNTIAFINDAWKMSTGGENINSSFVNQDLARLYRFEERAKTVATVFSGLALAIACLGLFGLVSFVMEQRKKEVGIRKVLGASVFELLIMLSKEFTMLVLIANVIAWPVAYYCMDQWLKDFAYHININWWLFLIAGAAALFIALLTVSYQAIKAATANPVESLQYE